MTRKWIEVNDLSNGDYSANKNIKFKTSTLRSYWCDFSDVYIDVKREVSVKGTENGNKRKKANIEE